MKKIFSLTLFVSFLFSSISFAQEARVITLQEAVQIALENNYQLKQAKNNLDLAEESIKSEYGDFLPSVSGRLSGSRSGGRQLVEVDDRQFFQDVVQKGIGGSISASVDLFAGFENIYSLRRSEETKLSREENLERAKETIIFQTASRYLQVILANEILTIEKENLETSRKQLEQVQAQVDVGSRPSVDLYNQESIVAQNELAVTRGENTLNYNKIVLIRQLQIDPLGNYEFVVPDLDEDIGSEDPSVYALSELIDQALLNRSDIRSEMAGIKAQEFSYKIAKGTLFPTLSASGTLSSNYSDKYRGGGISFDEQFFNQRRSNSVGLSLNVPIFQNWNRMYNIESAKINLKNAVLNLENTKLGVVQEVTQAYNDYISYKKELQSSEKAVIATEKAFETQQERYNVGASTLIEQSQAQFDYVDAQSNRTRALFNLIFQEKLLDYYLGKLSGESVEF